MHVCYLEHCGRKAARNCLFLLQRISKAFCVASSSQGYSFSCKQESARAHTHTHTHQGGLCWDIEHRGERDEKRERGRVKVRTQSLLPHNRKLTFSAFLSA